jgi:hypothetical protein
MDAVYVEAVVFPICESFGVGDNPAILFLSAKFYFVVVAVLVSHENEVGGNVVALAGIRVNINDAPIASRYAETPMPLIEQLCHSLFTAFLFFFPCWSIFLRRLLRHAAKRPRFFHIGGGRRSPQAS